MEVSVMYDVIIVGAGPAGIFTALELLKYNADTKILILEKGRIHRQCPKIKTKQCVSCSPCHITTGWGGAGAFSDGKLSLNSDVGGELPEHVGNIDELIRYVDNIYLEFGGSPVVHFNKEFAEKLSYEASKYSLKLIQCPVRHLGSEKSAQIMLRMYDKVVSYPHVTVKELTYAKSLIPSEDGQRITGVLASDGNIYHAANVVAGVGRVGSGWLTQQCYDLGIELNSKEVDIGVRVEVPRSVMDHVTNELYEMKVVFWDKNKVRSFCMNPGGFVSQENYDDDLAVVNGHCYQDVKSQNTNFALLTSIRFKEPFKDSIGYGKRIAKLVNDLTGGKIMVQRLEDIKMERRTTPERLKKVALDPTLKDAVPGDIGHAFTPRILKPILKCLEAMDHLCPGINGRDTLLYGPEVKFYSAKITVDEHLQTPVKGLYVTGDGAGITRGLIQASCSGVVVARHIAQAGE